MSSSKFFSDGSSSPLSLRSGSETSFVSTSIDAVSESKGSFGALRYIHIPSASEEKLAMSRQANAEILYMDLINQALASTSPEITAEILQSQVYAVIKENFGEIFKNSLDAYSEKLSRDSESDDSLILSIQIELDDTTISIHLEDNAGGFSRTFLSKVKDVDDRLFYLNKKALSGKLEHGGAIGGRSLGIRNLIANVETGHNLIGTTEETRAGESVSKAVFVFHYIKPAISSIDFDNRVDSSGNPQGAIISVTMTRQPIHVAESMGATVFEAEDDFSCDVPALSLDLTMFGPK